MNDLMSVVLTQTTVRSSSARRRRRAVRTTRGSRPAARPPECITNLSTKGSRDHPGIVSSCTFLLLSRYNTKWFLKNTEYNFDSKIHRPWCFSRCLKMYEVNKRVHLSELVSETPAHCYHVKQYKYLKYFILLYVANAESGLYHGNTWWCN